MGTALKTYGFLSAKLKTRISKALPPETIERLIRAPSLPEAVLVLRGTSYEDVEKAYSDTGDLRASEALLLERELDLYMGLRRYVDGPLAVFIEALTVRFEVDKLKHAVRLWFDATVRGRPVDGESGYLHRATIVHPFDVDAIINSPDAASVAAVLSSTPYAAIAADELPGAVARRSLFGFESALDRLYYGQVFSAAAGLPGPDRAVAERVLGVDADLQNVSWLIRFRGFYGMPAEEALSRLIPYGRAITRQALADAAARCTGSRGREPGTASAQGGSVGGVAGGATGTVPGEFGLELLRSAYGQFGVLLGGSGDAAARLSLLESALRQIMMAEARRSLGGNPFSVGIVLAYCTIRTAELRSIMTILYAREYALSEDRVRSAL